MGEAAGALVDDDGTGLAVDDGAGVDVEIAEGMDEEELLPATGIAPIHPAPLRVVDLPFVRHFMNCLGVSSCWQ